MDNVKGLTVEVYRSDLGDCTRGGISSTAGKLTVTGSVDMSGTFEPIAREARVFEPSGSAPEAWIYIRQIGGLVYCLIPALAGEQRFNRAAVKSHLSRWMMGGNYAATSDSRFPIPFYGAVAIHDRCEW